jgi:hypothetical protein
MSKAFEWYSINADGSEIKDIQNNKEGNADKIKL